VWFSETGMVSVQVKISEKSNEITAIPELLDIFDYTGCIVTVDAMGTQKDIAERIVKKRSDYVLVLKKITQCYTTRLKCFQDILTYQSLDKAKKEHQRESDNEHG